MFIFCDIETFAVAISLLVLEELEAVGVLSIDDAVEFNVPLGLSVLPPTGGGRGSLRLDRENCIIDGNVTYIKLTVNFYTQIVILLSRPHLSLPKPGMSKSRAWVHPSGRIPLQTTSDEVQKQRIIAT